jgi:hypothetical protein
MNDVLSGALVACYVMVAVFFLRFWTTSRDRLFGIFAGAFAVLAVQRLALSLTSTLLEDQTIFYLMRLAAFVLIIIAIVDKNRR